MEEAKPKKDGPLIIGMIGLIIVLLLGVKGIFWGLEQMAPPIEAPVWQPLRNNSDQETAYAMRPLTPEQRQAADIQAWLEQANNRIEAETTSKAMDGFWLYAQGADEYILYLPDQTRTLTAKDITATQERDTDGEITLVIRARTPEEGATTAPEEQLIAFQTKSDQWRGIRVKVIQDGQEQVLHKLVSNPAGELHSTEELYIGRF